MFIPQSGRHSLLTNRTLFGAIPAGICRGRAWLPNWAATTRPRNNNSKPCVCTGEPYRALLSPRRRRRGQKSQQQVSNRVFYGSTSPPFFRPPCYNNAQVVYVEPSTPQTLARLGPSTPNRKNNAQNCMSLPANLSEAALAWAPWPEIHTYIHTCTHTTVHI